MELFLCTILLFVCILSFVEDGLQKYNRTIYCLLTVSLIFFAGLREIGFDRDSENYAYYFEHNDDPLLLYSVEYSFILFARLFNLVTNDVHSLFLFYAIIGVTLKMFAFHRISQFWYMPVAIYLGYYYILHDLTQMRASIVSGLALCVIPLIYNGRRKAALCLILLGCLFHYSGVVLLPAVFFSKTDMSMRERLFWAAAIPVGYIMYFAQFNIVTQIHIPYITDKIEIYETMRDKGIIAYEINVFNLVFLVKCAIYLYVLYFYDIIRLSNQYLPIILRFMGVSIFTYLILAQLPVLSFRISELYGIVEIVLFTYVFYTIKQKWIGNLVVSSIAISLFIIYVFIQKILEAA